MGRYLGVPLHETTHTQGDVDAFQLTDLLSFGALGLGQSAPASGMLVTVGGNSVFAITTLGSTVVNNTGAVIAQAATDGFLYLPRCATGAPSGTPTAVTGAGAIVIGGDHHLYAELTTGTFTQIDSSGGTSTLGQVCNAGNIVNSVAASKGITWTTAGTFTATAPEVSGPTDQDMFLVAGSGAAAAAGRSLVLIAGAGNGVTNAATTNASLTLSGQASNGVNGGLSLVGGTSNGTNQGVTSMTVQAPVSTGNAAPGLISFIVAGRGASGSTAQTTATVMTLNGVMNESSGSVGGLLSFTPAFTDNATASSSAVARVINLNPSMNFTGSGSTQTYEAIGIQVVETHLASATTNYLMRCKTGAAGTTDVFSVKNSGLCNAAGGFVTDTATTSGFNIGAAAAGQMRCGSACVIGWTAGNDTAGLDYEFVRQGANCVTATGVGTIGSFGVVGGFYLAATQVAAPSWSATGTMTWNSGMTPQIMSPTDVALVITGNTNSASGFGGAQVTLQGGGAGITSGFYGNSVVKIIGSGPGNGSNLSGGVVQMQGGPATGTGQGGDLLQQTSFRGTSGSATQTQYDRCRFAGKITQSSAPGTSATVIPLVSMSTTTDSAIGGRIEGVIWVADATHDVSSIYFEMIWSASNRNGTVTAGTPTTRIVVSDTTTFTGLTTTVTAVVSGTAVVLKVTPSWGAGTPTIVQVNWGYTSYGTTLGTVQ